MLVGIEMDPVDATRFSHGIGIKEVAAEQGANFAIGVRNASTASLCPAEFDRNRTFRRFDDRTRFGVR